MKYKRRVAGEIWTDYNTNIEIVKELNVTLILDKIREYRRHSLQHINRMPRNRLQRIVKNYRPKGRRNQGRPLERLLEV